MGYFKRILNSCRQTTLLVLRSAEEKIPFKQQFEMQVHIRFCKCCRNFKKQSSLIDQSLRACFDEKDPPFKASDEFKNKLKERLK